MGNIAKLPPPVLNVQADASTPEQQPRSPPPLQEAGPTAQQAGAQPRPPPPLRRQVSKIEQDREVASENLGTAFCCQHCLV